MTSWHSAQRKQKAPVSCRRLPSALPHSCHGQAVLRVLRAVPKPCHQFFLLEGSRTLPPPQQLPVWHAPEPAAVSSTAIPPVLQRRGSTWREPSWEREPAPGAVPAPPERVLPADHLVQHDAQGPDGRCLAVVPAEVRPFRGAVGRCSYGIEMEFFRGTLPAPRASPQHPWACGGRTRCPLASTGDLCTNWGLEKKPLVSQEGSGSPGKARAFHAKEKPTWCWGKTTLSSSLPALPQKPFLSQGKRGQQSGPSPVSPAHQTGWSTGSGPPSLLPPPTGVSVALAAPAPAPVLGRGAGKGCQQGWKMGPQPAPLKSSSAEDSGCHDWQQKGQSPGPQPAWAVSCWALRCRYQEPPPAWAHLQSWCRLRLAGRCHSQSR